MSNPLSFWQERNDLIDQRIRTFERKFFIVKKVEPRPETPKPDGVIYERVKTRLTIKEALRRINDAEIETPEPGQVQSILYPQRKP